MPYRNSSPLRIGNRRFLAVHKSELAPDDSPLPSALAWGVLERELHRPTDLPNLQRLARVVGDFRQLRYAFQAGEWALIPAAAEAPAVRVLQAEPISQQLQSAKPVKTWIEMEVVDDFGRPQPNQPYLCMLPDGRIETGTLDSRGRVRFDGIDPGTCVFTLTELDQETWAKAA